MIELQIGYICYPFYIYYVQYAKIDHEIRMQMNTITSVRDRQSIIQNENYRNVKVSAYWHNKQTRCNYDMLIQNRSPDRPINTRYPTKSEEIRRKRRLKISQACHAAKLRFPMNYNFLPLIPPYLCLARRTRAQ